MQRKMLRMVLGSRRRLARAEDVEATSSDRPASEDNDDEDSSQCELEPWKDFLKRVTYLAEERATAAGLNEWLTTWRRKQWRWAPDDHKKWSNTALHWCPELHASRSNVRAQARPKKKWTDDLHGYLSDLGITQPWVDLAQMGDIWAELEPGFLKWGLSLSRHSA